MAELIQYHVRVKTDTGGESPFVMREPRVLQAGDRFDWHGHSYRVVSARVDPARPHLASIDAERDSSR